MKPIVSRFSHINGIFVLLENIDKYCNIIININENRRYQ